MLISADVDSIIVFRILQHLPMAVIGVACRSGAADGRDVAYVVIGVGIAVERGIALLVGQAAHQHRRAVGPGARHIGIALCQEAVAVQTQAAGSKTLEPVIGVGVLTVGRQSHRAQTAVCAVVGVAVDPVVPEDAVPRGAHLVARLRHAVGAVVVGKVDLYAVSTVPLRHRGQAVEAVIAVVRDLFHQAYHLLDGRLGEF